MAINNKESQLTKLPNLNDLPGPLRSEVTLTIQTREAQKLVTGRRVELSAPLHHKKHRVEHIMGLPSFGYRMNAIWIAAQYDDPYADWFLLQIESALASAKAIIKGKTQELGQLLENVDAIKIKTSHSIRPVDIHLNFANPYGYMGAYLVADFDALACALLTAWHIGLVDRAPQREILATTSKSIRRLFLLATRWQFTGVTRTSLRTGEKIAQVAQTKMGSLPQEILELKQRAKIAPEIRSVHAFVLPTASEETLAFSAVPVISDNQELDIAGSS